MTTFKALDGDTVDVDASTPARANYVGRQVALLDGASCPLDRETALQVAKALTDAVAAHDAAVKAKEDAKLKRGDVVRPNLNSVSRYVVIRGEGTDGTVDLVNLGTGSIREGERANRYRRPAPF